MTQAVEPSSWIAAGFLPLFVIMWIFICFMLAQFSGWAHLAARFRAANKPAGERFFLVSGSMGHEHFAASFSNCLTVHLDSGGFYMSLWPIFRSFQSANLYIPWSQVQRVQEKQFLFIRYASIYLKEHWPVISLHGRAGRRVLEMFPAGVSASPTVIGRLR